MIKLLKIYNLSIGYWSLVIGYYLELGIWGLKFDGDRHGETR
ncbi:MAG: hypothetical protein H6Q41_640, partial [Deltaproteobacteria bacterium]|nr:hypothetical protein [Deltaproteobacteria bacterium]